MLFFCQYNWGVLSRKRFFWIDQDVSRNACLQWTCFEFFLQFHNVEEPETEDKNNKKKVYKLSCRHCKMTYLSENGGKFRTRIKKYQSSLTQKDNISINGKQSTTITLLNVNNHHIFLCRRYSVTKPRSWKWRS